MAGCVIGCAAAAIDISDGANMSDIDGGVDCEGAGGGQTDNEGLSFRSAGAKFGNMVMAHNDNVRAGGADSGASVQWLASHSGGKSSASTLNAMLTGAALVAHDQDRNKGNAGNGREQDEHAPRSGTLHAVQQTAGPVSATAATALSKTC